MSMYPQSGSQKPWELEYARDDKSLSKFFNVVYAWMAVGLAVTAAVSYFVSSQPAIQNALQSMGRGSTIVIFLAMFLIATSVQASALRINANVATALFLLYAALMGVLISPIFYIYHMNTIGAAFLLTGGTFGVMSVYGLVTKRDLTGIGSFMVMAVWGLIIASVVNMFLASNSLSWLITYGILIAFIALTAYQTQKLKVFAQQYGSDPSIAPRIAIIGSLLLYIAFINMFISILRIMGDRK
jgi:FtsH-binding integral membrane protein